MKARLALLASALISASCSSSNDPPGCPQPKLTVLEGSPSLDQLEGSVKACIHFQSYRLSPAPGSTEQIAESVMQGCNSWIANWKHSIENSKGEYAVAAAGDAYFDSMNVEFRRNAIFRVTEARAGKCSLK